METKEITTIVRFGEEAVFIGKNVRVSIRANQVCLVREKWGEEHSQSWWDCTVVLEDAEGRYVACFVSERFTDMVPSLKDSIFRVKAERGTTKQLHQSRVVDFAIVVDELFGHMIEICKKRYAEGEGSFVTVELDPLEQDVLARVGAIFTRDGQRLLL